VKKLSILFFSVIFITLSFCANTFAAAEEDGGILEALGYSSDAYYKATPGGCAGITAVGILMAPGAILDWALNRKRNLYDRIYGPALADIISFPLTIPAALVAAPIAAGICAYQDKYKKSEDNELTDRRRSDS